MNTVIDIKAIRVQFKSNTGKRPFLHYFNECISREDALLMKDTMLHLDSNIFDIQMITNINTHI